jgi:hypothetical protein
MDAGNSSRAWTRITRIERNIEYSRIRNSAAAAENAAAARISAYWPVGSESCVIGTLLRLKLPPPE